MKSSIKFEEHGEEVLFFKEGWNSVAHIDNVPEIVELVNKIIGLTKMGIFTVPN